ncbi:MAG: MBL fold metallo-hydrolase [Planctomycetota bacterium]|jgi:glyoxylase-like metal-dependent hydrolase (beta-lactamase superfamily II)|nr:MBL fold metallo-hydrolase [Planctomycetota bacterium]
MMADDSPVRIETLEVGDLAVRCYIVFAAGVDAGAAPGGVPCVVVDPGGDTDVIMARILRLGLNLETILLTHAHADHIGGIEAILELRPEAELACSAETARRASDPLLNLSAFVGVPFAAPKAGRILVDGETFTAAGLSWRAAEVPGHDPGEMAFILGNDALFSGDVVFAGSVGRSDFPGGDGELLVRGVKKLLNSLSPDMPIYPGHGPATTVRRELAANPFLL